MSIAEIIPALRALSRSEKFNLAQMLLEDLASESAGRGPDEGRDSLLSTVELFPYCDRTGVPAASI